VGRRAGRRTTFIVGSSRFATKVLWRCVFLPDGPMVASGRLKDPLESFW
jgi:hypothetical protein